MLVFNSPYSKYGGTLGALFNSFSHLKPSVNLTKHPFGTLFAQCLHNGYTPI